VSEKAADADTGWALMLPKPAIYPRLLSPTPHPPYLHPAGPNLTLQDPETAQLVRQLREHKVAAIAAEDYARAALYKTAIDALVKVGEESLDDEMQS
jgi:hypothetical protein